MENIEKKFTKTPIGLGLIRVEWEEAAAMLWNNHIDNGTEPGTFVDCSDMPGITGRIKNVSRSSGGVPGNGTQNGIFIQDPPDQPHYALSSNAIEKIKQYLIKSESP